MEKADFPIRVLQVNANSKDFGGVSSFLYNVYLHIDRSKVQFDFLSPNITTYGIVKDEILSMGGRIFELGITGNKLTCKIRLYFNLLKFLKQERYSIVHINSGSFFFNLIVVKVAERAGVKTRIVHSHNSENASDAKLKKYIQRMLKPMLERSATKLLACSDLAAQHMFTPKAIDQGLVQIINNGIEVSRFLFDVQMREKVRHDMDIEDKFVIGHIGRFAEQKNHLFLLDVFAAVHNKEPSAILLLIGEGPLEGEVREKVNQLGLNKCVYFLGVRKDVDKLYQAMDCFVLPSLFEGLPVVGVEAQASGLKIFCSDSITRKLNIANLVEFISLSKSIEEWAEIILQCRNGYGRKNMQEEIVDAGYSIEYSAKLLKECYYECTPYNKKSI